MNGKKTHNTQLVPSLTLFEFPLCCLPSIYINKDEPHLYTNIISKVYLTSLRPYRTILLLLESGTLRKTKRIVVLASLHGDFNVVSVQYNGGLLPDIILAGTFNMPTSYQ